MSPEQEQMLKEIHAAIVHPEEDSLLAAAKAVVDARYSTNDWDTLKNAISRLADVLETAGKLAKGKTEPDVILECPICGVQQQAGREHHDPQSTSRIMVLCPDCDDGGGFPDILYFDADGRQITDF